MQSDISFDFEKKSEIKNTFRVQKIRSLFDYQNENSVEHFKGTIKLPDEWQIGVIVGASGTGKTSIARQIFGDKIVEEFEYKSPSVIDDMPKDCDIETITKTFYAVGFGSVPSWLKPYGVLSNGEKMRVDLANRLLRYDEAIIDEFTSVVDRNVAKTMCIATKKAMQKNPSKKLIVVSCHYDILEWLQPDWVYDTSENKSFFGISHDPNLNTKSGEWQKNGGGGCFMRYHYLSHDLQPSAQCYGLFDNDRIIGFCAVTHFPHPKNPRLKHCHRLVILPDYQGIGLGTRFLSEIAKIYANQGYDFSITTSARNLMQALSKRKEWGCSHYGKLRPHTGGRLCKQLNKTTSCNRETASFFWKGEAK